MAATFRNVFGCFKSSPVIDRSGQNNHPLTLLLVIVFLAAFIPTIVQLITARPTSQTHIVVVNDAGSIAGLGEAKLTAYISSELNGTTTGSRAPYAISGQPAASLGLVLVNC